VHALHSSCKPPHAPHPPLCTDGTAAHAGVCCYRAQILKVRIAGHWGETGAYVWFLQSRSRRDSDDYVHCGNKALWASYRSLGTCASWGGMLCLLITLAVWVLLKVPCTQTAQDCRDWATFRVRLRYSEPISAARCSKFSICCDIWLSSCPSWLVYSSGLHSHLYDIFLSTQQAGMCAW
jgi:hypothetical protein